MGEAGTIQITECAEVEVPASGAELRVVLSGTRLFTGGAALKEAVEVRRLVEALRACGAGEQDVMLVNVTVDVSKGLVARSSSATYQLRIACRDVALLPGFIDVVSDTKSARLVGVRWVYGSVEDKRAECMRRCVEQARAKANAIAEALGEVLEGVASVREPTVAQLHVESSAPVPGMARATRARVGEELAGLDLAPPETVRVALEVTFRVRAAAATR